MKHWKVYFGDNPVNTLVIASDTILGAIAKVVDSGWNLQEITKAEETKEELGGMRQMS